MITGLVLIFLSGFFAFAISAICGGGAGLMIIPVLRQFLPVSDIPGSLSIGTLSSSVSRIVLFRKDINWKIVLYFVPAALPAVWLGAWMLKFINPVYLEIVMGIFLVSNLPSLFRKQTSEPAKTRTSHKTLSFIGFLAGFLSGLTGAVGLIFNKFYLSYGLSKEEIIATRAANEVLLHLFKIVLYSLFGLLGLHVIEAGVAIALAAVCSSWSMKWILPRLSVQWFKKIGFSAMVLSGLLMLIQGSRSLAREKKFTISSKLQSKNLETKIQWQNLDYAMEFNFDEGFEFEQVIPVASLSPSQQQFIRTRNLNNYRVVIEAVYSIHQKSYEAYLYDRELLVDKFDFK